MHRSTPVQQTHASPPDSCLNPHLVVDDPPHQAGALSQQPGPKHVLGRGEYGRFEYGGLPVNYC
jgi:hypothetical protein